MASLKRWLDRRRNPWKRVFYDAFARWRKDNGQALLYDYSDLPEAPVVMDFGGFKVEWSDIVLAQSPRAIIHIFEPHPKFAAAIREKFSDQPDVHAHAFALGSETTQMQLSDAGDASSAVASHAKTFTAQFQSVGEFFSDNDLPHIDLAKINIEGGEYDLVPALINARVIDRIDRLQIQFHLFEPALCEARDAIRDRLAATHFCKWEYPFVWEEWRRR